MINQTDLDLRYAESFARTARIDRIGWMSEGTSSPDAPQDRGEEACVKCLRRRFGETLIALGERAKGTSTDHTTTSATVEYGPAI